MGDDLNHGVAVLMGKVEGESGSGLQRTRTGQSRSIQACSACLRLGQSHGWRCHSQAQANGGKIIVLVFDFLNLSGLWSIKSSY